MHGKVPDVTWQKAGIRHAVLALLFVATMAVVSRVQDRGQHVMVAMTPAHAMARAQEEYSNPVRARLTRRHMLNEGTTTHQVLQQVAAHPQTSLITSNARHSAGLGEQVTAQGTIKPCSTLGGGSSRGLPLLNPELLGLPHAVALSDTIFTQLLPLVQQQARAAAAAGSGGVPYPELRHPLALGMLQPAQQLWSLLRQEEQQAGAYSLGPEVPAVLQQLDAAAAQLEAVACAQAGRSKEAAAPHAGSSEGEEGERELVSTGFPAARRAALSVMMRLALSAHDGGRCGASWQQIQALLRPLLARLARTTSCALSVRPVLEMMHISKSGGTTVCSLAHMNGAKNPSSSISSNCMVAGFKDEPKWVSGDVSWVPSSPECRVWSAYTCPDWLQEREVGCKQRLSHMASSGWDFYNNEHALHGSSPDPASSHVCWGMRSAVVLREPLHRAQSHLLELRGMFRNLGLWCKNPDGSNVTRLALPTLLSYFSSFSPAVIDNYSTRSLLGKHGHCRPFRSLSVTDLHHASLKLLSFDHVMVLTESARASRGAAAGAGGTAGAAAPGVAGASEAAGLASALQLVMQGSMRWNHTLGELHERQAPPLGDLETGQHFPPGSRATLLSWNQHDAALHRLGTLLMRLDAALLHVEQQGGSSSYVLDSAASR